MNLWRKMLIFILTIPVIFTIIGIIFYKLPPKKINKWIGYRTKKSMTDQTSWDFANKYSAKMLLYRFPVFLFFSTLIMIPFYNMPKENIIVISFLLFMTQIILLISVYTETEEALKKLKNEVEE